MKQTYLVMWFFFPSGFRSWWIYKFRYLQSSKVDFQEQNVAIQITWSNHHPHHHHRHHQHFMLVMQFWWHIQSVGQMSLRFRRKWAAQMLHSNQNCLWRIAERGRQNPGVLLQNRNSRRTEREEVDIMKTSQKRTGRCPYANFWYAFDKNLSLTLNGVTPNPTQFFSYQDYYQITHKIAWGVYFLKMTITQLLFHLIRNEELCSGSWLTTIELHQ